MQWSRSETVRPDVRGEPIREATVRQACVWDEIRGFEGGSSEVDDVGLFLTDFIGFKTVTFSRLKENLGFGAVAARSPSKLVSNVFTCYTGN